MTNDLPASEQLDVIGESQRTKGVGQSNHGSGNFDKAGIQSELPPNIKAIQETAYPVSSGTTRY